MKKIVVVVILAAAAAGAWFLFKRPAPAAAEEEAKPTALVQVAPLQTQAISRTLPAFGVVEAAPSGLRTLSLGYDCVVKSVAAGLGARVAAGDPILVIVPTPDARLQIDSARSDSALAEKALASAQQRYDLKLATNQDLLAAQQAAEDARLKLASYEQRGLGGDGRVAAPEAGIVTRLDWAAGATVPAGTVLAAVSATARLEAHLAIEAADAAQVQAGQPVTLTPASRPDAAPVTSTVRMVGASVDPTSGSADLRVPLPAEAGWYPGEHVQAAIEVEKKTTLVAPRAAVLPDDDQQILYTVKDNKAVKHVVQVGIASGDSVEVSAKDLQAGDSAVTVGNYELEDGMAVQLAAKDAKADEAKPDEKKADDAKPEAKP